MTFGPITQLLRARAAGDTSSEAALMELVYQHLHHLAELKLRSERSGHTLSPTALVHEAWLRLRPDALPNELDRKQFFALAARRMRQVLIDHARRRQAAKRDGGAPNDWMLETAAGEPGIDALALDQALNQLQDIDARKAQVVELRYFGGMEMAELAEVLGISRATAQRDWELARAYLHLQLR